MAKLTPRQIEMLCVGSEKVYEWSKWRAMKPKAREVARMLKRKGHDQYLGE